MDNYFIKIIGKVNVPEMISIGHNYELLLKGSVTDEKKEDAENGYYEYTATFRPITGQVKTELGKTIKLKDSRSRSTQIRSVLYRLWEAQGDTRDSDIAYDDTMRYVLAHLEEIYLKAKLN